MSRKLFGIELDVFLSRTTYAALYGILTIIIFYELPDYFIKSYGASLSNLPLDNSSSFVTYAILITILSSIQIIFQDYYIGDTAAISNGIAQIFYIYIFTNGGLITEQISGAMITLDFSTLIYLMMLPSVLLIISSVISASSRSSVASTQVLEVHLD